MERTGISLSLCKPSQESREQLKKIGDELEWHTRGYAQVDATYRVVYAAMMYFAAS